MYISTCANLYTYILIYVNLVYVPLIIHMYVHIIHMNIFLCFVINCKQGEQNSTRNYCNYMKRLQKQKQIQKLYKLTINRASMKCLKLKANQGIATTRQQRSLKR